MNKPAIYLQPSFLGSVDSYELLAHEPVRRRSKKKGGQCLSN